MKSETEDLLKNPLWLKNNGDAGSMTRASDLMGGSLDDSEQRFAGETKAPPVGVDISWNVRGKGAARVK